MKQKLPKSKRRELRNFRASPEEWRRINAAARKFGDGNVGAWIRYATLNFKKSMK